MGEYVSPNIGLLLGGSRLERGTGGPREAPFSLPWSDQQLHGGTQTQKANGAVHIKISAL